MSILYLLNKKQFKFNLKSCTGTYSILLLTLLLIVNGNHMVGMASLSG